MSKKILKTFSSLVTLALALTVGQLVAPAAQASGDTIYVHAACSEWWNHPVAASLGEVINVSPGDTVNFTSVYQRDGHLCDRVSWNADRDLNTVFEPGLPDYDSAIPASFDLHISADAQPGMYVDELWIYNYENGFGTSYKFLVTNTKIQPSNTFDCNHNDVVPLALYVTAEPDTFYSQVITGGCDQSKGYGNMSMGAVMYDSDGTNLGQPFFWNGSWGQGMSYSYYRGHTEQAFYVVVPTDAQTLEATNIAANSVQLNGNVTDNGIAVPWGGSTTSNIRFCISSSADATDGILDNCDIANESGSPALTDSIGSEYGVGAQTFNTTSSSYLATGLTTGYTYYYQVIGVNGAGVNTYGAIMSTVPTETRSPQELSWETNTSLDLPQSGMVYPRFDPSYLGEPNITYTVVQDEDTTSNCAIQDATERWITVSTAGTCKVRVTSEATSDYQAASVDVVFFFATPAATIAWNPDATIRFTGNDTYFPSSQPYTDSSEPIVYNVLGGSSDCSIDISTGAVSFNVSEPGSCYVSASVAATANLAAKTINVYLNFTAQQSLNWVADTNQYVPESGTFVLANPISVLGEPNVGYEVEEGNASSGCVLTDQSGLEGATLSVSQSGTCYLLIYVDATDGYEGGTYEFELYFNKKNPTIIWNAVTEGELQDGGAFELSTDPTIDSDGTRSYEIIGGTSNCSLMDPSHDGLNVSTLGTCVIRLTVAESNLYRSATYELTMNFAKKSQQVTYAPTLTGVIPTTGIFVPNVRATALGEASVTYAVVSGSGTTSNCSILDATNNAITVSTPGTCSVLVTAIENGTYLSATATVTFTFTVDPNADTAPAEGDGNLAPKAVGSTGKFIATNDPTFLVSWDKKNGKLTSQATGIYTGYIQASITFTKAGKTYTCTAQFGVLKAMPGKTAKDKQKAMASKVFTGKQFCIDKTKLDPKTTAPKGGLTKANFVKIKPMNKSASELKQEKAALSALKGFTGEVLIQVIRYRAWPTTMVNIGDFNSKGGKIPTLIRNTKVNLG